MAHANGCDLVFASVREKIPTQLFKAMLTRHVFDLTVGAKLDRDGNSALNIYSG